MTTVLEPTPPETGATVSSRGRSSRSPQLKLRRRRLLLGSAPVVVVLLIIAVRLLTLNAVHDQTLDAYLRGDKARALVWGERQGWVNVVEEFRHPFAMGDAQLLSGHYALARPWFEQAFEQVPKGGIDECKIRVNLGLTYEALGDEAKARERTQEWKQFYDKGVAITRDRPPLCDAPEGGRTGEQLSQAQERLEQKARPEPGDEEAPQQQQPQPTPQPTPKPNPAPDPENTPSPEQQDALRELQRRNTIERNLQRGDDRTIPDGGLGTYPRPW